MSPKSDRESPDCPPVMRGPANPGHVELSACHRDLPQGWRSRCALGHISSSRCEPRSAVAPRELFVLDPVRLICRCARKLTLKATLDRVCSPFRSRSLRELSWLETTSANSPIMRTILRMIPDHRSREKKEDVRGEEKERECKPRT